MSELYGRWMFNYRKLLHPSCIPTYRCESSTFNIHQHLIYFCMSLKTFHMFSYLYLPSMCLRCCWFSFFVHHFSLFSHFKILIVLKNMIWKQVLCWIYAYKYFLPFCRLSFDSHNHVFQSKIFKFWYGLIFKKFYECCFCCRIWLPCHTQSQADLLCCLQEVW